MDVDLFYGDGYSMEFKGNEVSLKGMITERLPMSGRGCPVVKITVTEKPENMDLPSIFVAKVYDGRFLRDPLDSIPDETDYPQTVYKAETTAYEILINDDRVKNHLARYYGHYKVKCENGKREFDAILIEFREGKAPEEISEALAKKLEVELKPVLKQCHVLGVAHGDVKPGNLHMKTSDGDGVVLLDWGGSRIREGKDDPVFETRCQGDIRGLEQLAA